MDRYICTNGVFISGQWQVRSIFKAINLQYDYFVITGKENTYTLCVCVFHWPLESFEVFCFEVLSIAYRIFKFMDLQSLFFEFYHQDDFPIKLRAGWMKSLKTKPILWFLSRFTSYTCNPNVELWKNEWNKRRRKIIYFTKLFALQIDHTTNDDSIHRVTIPSAEKFNYDFQFDVLYSYMNLTIHTVLTVKSTLHRMTPWSHHWFIDFILFSFFQLVY